MADTMPELPTSEHVIVGSAVCCLHHGAFQDSMTCALVHKEIKQSVKNSQDNAWQCNVLQAIDGLVNKWS